MKTYRTAFVIGLMILVQQLDSIASEQMTNVTSDGGVNIKEDTGQGRFLASLYFPFFPQFYNTNYGDVWESLTRADTIGYFVLRDIASYFGTMGFWVLFHSAIWSGAAKSATDLPFPFNAVAYFLGAGDPEATINFREDDDGGSYLIDRQSVTNFDRNYFGEGGDLFEDNGLTPAQDKLNAVSLGQISRNGLINFLTNPENAAFNLYLSLGFGAFGMMVWLAPTFFWGGTELPETDTIFPNEVPKRRRDEDLGIQIESKYAKVLQSVNNEADMVKVYNRLMCPMCVARLAVIIGVGLTGKILFWLMISLLPKQWPDIFFRPFTTGLTITDRRRSFSHPSTSLTSNLEQVALFFLDEMEHKINLINKDIL